jgi:hypothetical protein
MTWLRFKSRLLLCGIIGVILVLLWALNSRPSIPIVESFSLTVNADKKAAATAEQPFREIALPATQEAVDDSVTGLASTAGAQLMEWQREDDPKLRDMRADKIAALLRGADLKQIANRLPDDVLDFALGLPVFQKWMASNPVDAAQWMSHHPSVADTRVSKLIREWNQSNSAAAREYAEELPAGAWRDKVVAVMVRQSLKSDPKEAIEWADELSSGPVQTGLLRNAIAAWGQSDPQTAAAWIGQIGDPVLKDQLAESLAVTYAATDPESALNFAMENVQAPASQANAIADITAVWAAQEPEKASRWTEQLPDGDARRMALSQLIHVWGSNDPTTAAGWIDGMPQGLLRDEAIHFFQTLTNRPVDSVIVESAVRL